jgi:hypothetical protein
LPCRRPGDKEGAVIKTGTRPCSLLWGLVVAGSLLTSAPARAELPLVVMYEGSEAAAMIAPERGTHVALAAAELPAAAERAAERVADAEIHRP